MTLSTSTRLLPPAALLQRAVLASLAVMVLLAGFTGRAGVQVVDEAMAQQLFRLHTHDIPGEQLYIQTFGEPAPFVPGHCHDDPNLTASHAQPDSNEVQAAASLAGSILCSAGLILPVLPPARASARPAVSGPALAVSVAPASPPPQS